MKIPPVISVVVPATHCPHYLTPEYAYTVRADVCAKCIITPHEPNKQLRAGAPRQR